MKELIKEARAKIKPVIQAMPEEELRSLIKDIEEVKNDKDIVLSREAFYEVLTKTGLTLEELRLIQDKHYEVDVEYELTRDLYEKQRVYDQYLMEHKEDNQLLNQYYSNEYYKAKMLKHDSIIYYLPYKMKNIRNNFRMMCFTTALSTIALTAIYPPLALLMSYDVYLLARGTQIMN